MKNLSQHQTELTKLLSDKFDKAPTQKDQAELLTKEEWKKIILGISQSGGLPIISLLYSYLSFKNNQEMEFNALTKFIFDDPDLSAEVLITIADYIRGGVYVFVSMNAYTVDDKNTLNIKGVSPLFEEAVLTFINSDKFVPFLNTIRSFMDLKHK